MTGGAGGPMAAVIGDRMTSLGKKDYSYADGNDALLCEMGNRQDTYRNIDIIKVVARSW